MPSLEWDKQVFLDQTYYDEGLAAELLALFRDSFSSDLQKIKEAMADHDLTTVTDAAHSIKGSAASLGIEGVRRVAYAIEKAGREKELRNAWDSIDDLEVLLEKIRELA